MCDYSLMNFPNRLAREGEILLTHKYSNGSIGLVSPAELLSAELRAQRTFAGFWSKVRLWFLGPPSHSVVPAICIPPGARLKVRSISQEAREMLDAAPGEDVVFTQITAASNRYRDAVRTAGKNEVLLQSVGEGLEILVVSLTLADEAHMPEEYSYSRAPR